MAPDKKLTDAEFTGLKDFIYKKTGILFTERNRFLLDARIREILHQTGCKDALTYLRSLSDPGANPVEVSRLINKVTITETSFFRDPHQITAMARNVIPEIAKRHEQLGARLLTIWSAGSSSGEEAYTLAILLAEHFKADLPKWNITIFATDINDEALQVCKAGVYKSYTLRNAPPAIRDKYFQAMPDDRYAVREDLKRLVMPQKLNLMDYSGSKRYTGADLILLRNVMIYFEAGAKAQVLHMCYENLRENGYLFLGQSETAFGISHAFKLVTFVNAFAYKKMPPVR
jgi:chemotaxis protein methyltransferase CheR